MNKAQAYFGAENGDFSIYARPIPKCTLQCQSVTNTVTQHLNTVQMLHMNRVTN